MGWPQYVLALGLIMFAVIHVFMDGVTTRYDLGAYLLRAAVLCLLLSAGGFFSPKACGATAIPTAAKFYRADLTRNARVVMGLDAPVSLFAAQIHQESGWRASARSGVGAQGLAQFMPATANWISDLFPELARNDPYNPGWSLRALVRYDDWLYARIRAADACQRWAMALSAYNGGLGWIGRDQARASRLGLDQLVWFGSVETVNAGRSASNWRENRDYPRRIIYDRQPLYVAAGWGPGVCL